MQNMSRVTGESTGDLMQDSVSRGQLEYQVTISLALTSNTHAVGTDDLR